MQWCTGQLAQPPSYFAINADLTANGTGFGKESCWNYSTDESSSSSSSTIIIPVVVHYFSNGGAFVAEKLGQMIQDAISGQIATNKNYDGGAHV